jgi:benzoyl-CoA reductase subunit C
MDVPQNYDPAAGGRFWRQELSNLRDDLMRLAGTPISDDALRHSIDLYNEHSQEMRDLYELRNLEPWFFPASELYLVLRAGNLLPV